MLSLLTPLEISRSLGNRTREQRLLQGWTRVTLAKRAGVSAASLKRFETTGKASLELVLRVAHALARLEEFGKLLQSPPARSMDELERRSATSLRKRGRI